MFEDGEEGEVGDAAMLKDMERQAPGGEGGDGEEDKQSVCIQTLVAGNGKAYIELFYLSHLANTDLDAEEAEPAEEDEEAKPTTNSTEKVANAHLGTLREL